MKELDAWVACHGNGRYEIGDWVPMRDFMLLDDAGIQPEFLQQLSSGAIDGRRRTLRTIQQTKNMGIVFYEQ